MSSVTTINFDSLHAIFGQPAKASDCGVFGRTAFVIRREQDLTLVTEFLTHVEGVLKTHYPSRLSEVAQSVTLLFLSRKENLDPSLTQPFVDKGVCIASRTYGVRLPPFHQICWDIENTTAERVKETIQSLEELQPAGANLIVYVPRSADDTTAQKVDNLLTGASQTTYRFPEQTLLDSKMRLLFFRCKSISFGDSTPLENGPIRRKRQEQHEELTKHRREDPRANIAAWVLRTSLLIDPLEEQQGLLRFTKTKKPEASPEWQVPILSKKKPERPTPENPESKSRIEKPRKWRVNFRPDDDI